MFVSQFLDTLVRGAQAPSRPVELSPGQILRGTILRAYPGDTVLVQMGGNPVYAKLDAPLEVGQQAWFQVMPKTQPVTLKVVDAPFEQIAGKADATISLESLLRGLGIKTDRTTLQHAKLLFDAGIPLNSKDLSQMLAILRQSSSPARTLQVLQLAHMRGLPIQGEVIASLESFLFGKPPTQSLSQVLSSVNQDSNSHPLWRNLANLLGRIGDLSNPLLSSTGSGMRLEGEPAKGQSSAPISEGRSPSLANAKEQIIPNLLKMLGLNHERNLALQVTSGQNFTQGNQELDQLKAIMLKLLDGVARDNIEIRDALEQGVRWLTGQQLLMASSADTPWSSFILQIPLFSLNKEFSSAFLQVEGQRDEKGTIDAENCHLFFHLDLEMLKTTLIDVKIVNRIMSITVFNDHPLVREWIENYKGELENTLAEMNYHLSSIKVSSLPQESQEKAESKLKYPIVSTYQGVDVRI